MLNFLFFFAHSCHPQDGKHIPPQVKAGDRVLIPTYGGNTIKVGDEEYHIFRDHEILAKIKE